MQSAAEGVGVPSGYVGGSSLGAGNAGIFGGAGLSGLGAASTGLEAGWDGEHMQILDAAGNTVGVVDTHGNPVMSVSR